MVSCPLNQTGKCRYGGVTLAGIGQGISGNDYHGSSPVEGMGAKRLIEHSDGASVEKSSEPADFSRWADVCQLDR
jgi:hypothetical protein